MTRAAELAHRALTALAEDAPLETRLVMAGMHLRLLDPLSQEDLSSDLLEVLESALDEAEPQEERANKLVDALYGIISASGAAAEREYQEMKERGIAED